MSENPPRLIASESPTPAEDWNKQKRESYGIEKDTGRARIYRNPLKDPVIQDLSRSFVAATPEQIKTETAAFVKTYPDKAEAYENTFREIQDEQAYSRKKSAQIAEAMHRPVEMPVEEVAPEKSVDTMPEDQVTTEPEDTAEYRLKAAKERLQKHAEGLRAVGLESEAREMEGIAAASTAEIHEEHSKIEPVEQVTPLHEHAKTESVADNPEKKAAEPETNKAESAENAPEKKTAEPEKKGAAINENEKLAKKARKEKSREEKIATVAIGTRQTLVYGGTAVLAGGAVALVGGTAFSAFNGAIGFGPLLTNPYVVGGGLAVAGGTVARFLGVGFLDMIGWQLGKALFGNKMAGLKSIGNDMFSWIAGGKEVFKGADPSGGGDGGAAKPKKAAGGDHGGGGHAAPAGGGGHH